MELMVNGFEIKKKIFLYKQCLGYLNVPPFLFVYLQKQVEKNAVHDFSYGGLIKSFDTQKTWDSI